MKYTFYPQKLLSVCFIATLLIRQSHQFRLSPKTSCRNGAQYRQNHCSRPISTSFFASGSDQEQEVRKCSSSSSKVRFSFEEARNVARARGHSSIEEFLEYDCPGAYSVPKNPDELFADEWQGWGDFLGLMFPYEEAVAKMKELMIESEDEFYEMKAKNDPRMVRFPAQPEKYYKGKWQGWGAFKGYW